MPDAPKQQKLRLKDKRQRLMWVKVAAGASVVALALLIVWYVARIPQLTIAKVEVSGTASLDGGTIQNAAAGALSGSYFFFIPRANALVYPKSAVTAAIVNAFPEIANVSVTRDGWNALKVLVSERSPVALWCAGTPDKAGDCYLADKDGYVYAKAADGAAFLRFFGKLSGNPVGSTFDASDFASLKHFVEELSSTVHRTPQSVLVEDNDDVTVAFVQGGTLMFVRTADRPALLDNITSVFAARGISATETLDYADFRFGDKVYVKFQEH